MVPVSGWIGSRTLGVNGFWQLLAAETGANRRQRGFPSGARKLCIHDQYFPTIAAVITVVETQFEKWTNGNATLRRLCSI
jgi:hypothetical protein